VKILISAIGLLACLLAGCTRRDLPVKVIVGATLVDPPIPYSVIIVKDGKITDIGPQQTVPVPTASEKISGVGKYVIPIQPGAKLQVGASADLLLVSDPKDSATAERTMRGGLWINR
jgi:dihydroorotase-like cyclic amidohydrolase